MLYITQFHKDGKAGNMMQQKERRNEKYAEANPKGEPAGKGEKSSFGRDPFVVIYETIRYTVVKVDGG